MPDEKFMQKMMKAAQYGDCMRAGIAAYQDGTPIALAALRDNGFWSVVPWPEERLTAIVADGVSYVKALTDDKPERARFAAAHIIGAAIADVLGVPQP
jgi:hypothetical protein